MVYISITIQFVIPNIAWIFINTFKAEAVII